MLEQLDELLPYQFLSNKPSNVALFLGVLLLGWVLQRFFAPLLSRLAFRFFSGWAGKDQLKLFIRQMKGPIGRFLFVFFLFEAFLQLRFPENMFVSEAFQMGFKEVFRASFGTIAIITFVLVLLRLTNFIGEILLEKAKLTPSKTDDHLVPFLKELTKVFLVVLAFFTILGVVFRVNVATLVTGLGISGLAVALAGKETLENLFASFTIFLDRPFIAGDLVQIGSIIGRIEKVGFRTTRIRTLDRSLLTLPNKMMIDQPVDNWNERQMWRARFNIALPYDTPLDLVRKIKSQILSYLQAHPKTTIDNKVYFAEFGQNGIELTIFMFAITNDYFEFMEIRDEANFKLHQIVTEAGAQIALPTRVVYFRDSESAL